MEYLMRENGNREKDKASEYKYGLMALNMLDNGN